ncbi:MAG: hypothetical protein ABIK89_24155, partial [Planctomycetota bacterium]
MNSAGAAPITGSTGPGGFEATNVSSSLLYWVRGDAGITQVSGAVSAWQSQGFNGSSYKFEQLTAANQPTVIGTFGPKSLPAVRFDGSSSPNNDRLVMSNATTAQTVVIVDNLITNPGNLCGIWGQNGADFGIRYLEGANGWMGGPNYADWANGGQSFVNGAPGGAVTKSIPHILTQTRPSPSNVVTAIGDYWNNATYGRVFGGDIAEIAVYTRALNSAELSVVANSLNAKYNVGSTLSGSDWTLGVNDYYAGDTAGNGDYDLDVFGIGRAGDDQVRSAGSQGFGIMSTALEDDEWVL